MQYLWLPGDRELGAESPELLAGGGPEEELGGVDGSGFMVE